MRTLNDDVIRMGNQIAGQFRHLPVEAAAAAVANHISNFWEKRMREKLLARVALGQDDLDPILIAAADRLQPQAPPQT